MTGVVMEKAGADSPAAWEKLGLLLIDVLQTLIVPPPCCIPHFEIYAVAPKIFCRIIFFITALVTKKTAANCRSPRKLA